MCKVAGAVGHAEPARRATGQTDTRKARRLLNQVWLSSSKLTGSDPVTKYLRGRGQFMAVKDVRYCPACYESDTRSKMPAMVSMVRNRAGKPVCIHRTYLNGSRKVSIRSPKKLMPRTEPLSGCAIRLIEANDTVGVAEGIETAIAANQLFGVPTWATIGTTIMESFEPPVGVRRITIFADHDANYAGQVAAYKLAKGLYLRDYIVDVKLPDRGDWADQIGQRSNQ